MYTLREINSKNVEFDQELGKSYHKIFKEKSPEEFEKTLKILEKSHTSLDDVYGVIVFNDGSEIFALRKCNQYYIMSSDGKTFANVSYK